MEGLIALAGGLFIAFYLFSWFDGYLKERDADSREREAEVRFKLSEAERLGATSERVRGLLTVRFRKLDEADQEVERLFSRWISKQISEGVQADEAWQESPVLAPLHQHWWRLVDAATLHLATTLSNPARPDIRSLTSHLIADNDDIDLLDDSELDDLVEDFVDEFCEEQEWESAPDEDDLSEEQLEGALLHGIQQLAERRPLEAARVQLALAGHLDMPGTFSGDEQHSGLLSDIAESYSERRPRFARDPFIELT